MPTAPMYDIYTIYQNPICQDLTMISPFTKYLTTNSGRRKLYIFLHISRENAQTPNEIHHKLEVKHYLV